MTERLLTVDQVAELVQLSAKTVMRAINAGHLEASQLTQGRGGWRVRPDAIDGWLEARSNRQREPRPLAPVRRVDPLPAPSAPRLPRAPRRGGRLTVDTTMGKAA